MNILLINGSPARPSHTSATLQKLAELFAAQDSSCEIIDLVDLNLPINDPVYHADASTSPDEKVRGFVAKIKHSNIIVLGTPLYHGSFSGLLKVALDNLDDDAFKNRKVLLIANASGARGSMQAAQHLVVVPRTMGAQVHNRLIGTCKTDFELINERYSLTNPEIIDRCGQIVSELLQDNQ